MMEKYGKVQEETYEVVNKETGSVVAKTKDMNEALRHMEKNANCEIEVKTQ